MGRHRASPSAQMNRFCLYDHLVSESDKVDGGANGLVGNCDSLLQLTQLSWKG
jgi:hypothetical protein